MNKEKINLLAELLEEWFKNYTMDGRNFLNQNKIAKLIKKNLKKSNNWKNQPRGKQNNLPNLEKGRAAKEILTEKISKLELELEKTFCKCGSPVEMIVSVKTGKVSFACSDFLDCKFS